MLRAVPSACSRSLPVQGRAPVERGWSAAPPQRPRPADREW
jgi:hypothetical protein